MIERLDFGQSMPYNAAEASSHLNRYAMVKPIIKNKKVLDAACGEGYGSYLLKTWGASEVVGVDVSQTSIDKAASIFKCEGLSFQCQNVETLQFPNHYFDVIVSFETLEHLDHPENFLKGIRRVLKPGGTIIISCPNDPYYYPDEETCNPFHKKKYTYFDFKNFTEQFLGNHAHYFLAFSVNGFLNVPFSYSTEPSDSMPLDMLEMMNYISCDNSLLLKQDRYLNHWNCNYYIGIWGKDNIVSTINAVFYPREFFNNLKDEDVELIKEIKVWQNQKDKDYIDYKKELDLQQLKCERFSSMLELVNKEADCLRQNYDTIYSAYQSSKNELELLKKQQNEERQNHENNLDLISNELDCVKRKCQSFEVELSTIKKSKGWKLLMLIYKIEGAFRFR